MNYNLKYLLSGIFVLVFIGFLVWMRYFNQRKEEEHSDVSFEARLDSEVKALYKQLGLGEEPHYFLAYRYLHPWFNLAIVLSDLVFFANVAAMITQLFVPDVRIPFAFDAQNIYIVQLMLFNWLLMILLYLLQINIALASQFGQATTKQIWLALVSYLTYSQLFIVVSLDAVGSVILDKILKRKETKWVKTKRFAG